MPNAIYLVENFSGCKSEKYGGNMESVETVLITTAATEG